MSVICFSNRVDDIWIRDAVGGLMADNQMCKDPYLFMPGMFPQKYLALWAGLTFTASSSTGLHCQTHHTRFRLQSVLQQKP